MATKRIRGDRKPTHVSFEAAVYWIGLTIILTFLLWTVGMVVLEAFEQWRG